MTRELDHPLGSDGLVHAWGTKYARTLFECHWWAPTDSMRKAVGLTDDPVTCIACAAKRPYAR